MSTEVGSTVSAGSVDSVPSHMERARHVQTPAKPDNKSGLERRRSNSDGPDNLLRRDSIDVHMRRLLSHPLALCAFLEAIPQQDNNVCVSLLSILHAHDLAFHLLAVVIPTEIQKTSDQSLLFREGSHAALFLSTYAQLEGHDYLLKTVEREVVRVLVKGQKLEIDPSRSHLSAVRLSKNRKLLAKVAQHFLETIMAVPLPESLRIVCQLLKEAVVQKFPEAISSVLGGFLFLRFICPSIVTPEKYFAVSGDLAGHRRTLILVAKLLQSLTNHTFGNEAYMICMDKFITDNAAPLSRFYSRVCENVILPRKLATVHSTPSSVTNMASELSTAKKLQIHMATVEVASYYSTNIFRIRKMAHRLGVSDAGMQVLGDLLNVLSPWSGARFASPASPKNYDSSFLFVKDVHSWSVEEVVSWAASEGLPVLFLDALSMHNIDGAKLLNLTLDSLAEMNLGKQDRATNFLALVRSLDPDAVDDVVQSGSMLYSSEGYPATSAHLSDKAAATALLSVPRDSSPPARVGASPSSPSSMASPISTSAMATVTPSSSALAPVTSSSPVTSPSSVDSSSPPASSRRSYSVSVVVPPTSAPSLECTPATPSSSQDLSRSRRKSAGDISQIVHTIAAATAPPPPGLAGAVGAYPVAHSRGDARSVVGTLSVDSGTQQRRTRLRSMPALSEEKHARFLGAQDSLENLRRAPSKTRKGVSFPVATSAPSSELKCMAKRWTSAQVEEWCVRASFWKFYVALADDTSESAGFNGARLLKLRKTKQLKRVGLDKEVDADEFLAAIERLRRLQNSPAAPSPLLSTGLAARILNDHAFSDAAEHLQTLKDLVLAMHVELTS
eukprot:CAMPEP_0174234090 /NCGR_PEP_ID=MMETSP0417-20130205/3946_1 /TAXON_ID=242541 /ORGANISM="Mayorella sp, Strain BSH-02190019" /LENGTH=840 /DNA_ID=CAMNT_0015312401 /DNA_START=188 /DNA_END=2713 /DNA_ORIENTATION=+